MTHPVLDWWAGPEADFGGCVNASGPAGSCPPPLGGIILDNPDITAQCLFTIPDLATLPQLVRDHNLHEPESGH